MPLRCAICLSVRIEAHMGVTGRAGGGRGYGIHTSGQILPLTFQTSHTNLQPSVQYCKSLKIITLNYAQLR